MNTVAGLGQNIVADRVKALIDSYEINADNLFTFTAAQ
jgi:hypothetical protein